MKRTATTLGFHMVLVCIVFTLGKGVRKLFTEGLTTGAQRFLEGTSHTLTRLSDPVERINALLDSPENLGFLLLGTPDERVFGNRPPPTTPIDDLYSDPSILPTRRPEDPTEDPCKMPDQYAARVDLLLVTIEKTPELTEGAAIELACWLEKMGSLDGKDALRLIRPLEDREPRVARPMLRLLLLTRPYLGLHRLIREQVDDILRTYGAPEVARQVDTLGWGGLAKMTRVGTGSTGPSQPTTGAPPPTAKPPARAEEEPERPTAWLAEVYSSHGEYESCLGVQERLTRAYQRYRKVRTDGQSVLNLKEMKEVQILREIPFCPGGGTYGLGAGEQIECSKHGSKDSPWPKAREFQTYFRPLEIARETLDAGRYREALATADRFLKRQPNHVWMLETKAEAALELEQFPVAAQDLYRIAFEFWEFDAWVLYNAGFAYYATGNNIQAISHFRKLLSTASWENAKRRIASRYEYYRLLERTRWILSEFLEPRNDLGEPQEPIRFLEFKVAREPTWSVDTCRQSLGEARQRINEFIVNYYDSPVLKRLYQELKTLRKERTGLKPYEVEAIEENAARIAEIEEKISRFRSEDGKASSGSVVRDLSRQLRDEGLPAHARANYRIDAENDLHCTEHPYLLEDASLAGLRLTDQERAALNVSLSYAILARMPVLKECYGRQKAIWEFWNGSPPAAYRAERVAASLNMASPAEAECPEPRKGAGFGIFVDPKTQARHLRCATHGSFETFFDPGMHLSKELR